MKNSRQKTAEEEKKEKRIDSWRDRSSRPTSSGQTGIDGESSPALERLVASAGHSCCHQDTSVIGCHKHGRHGRNNNSSRTASRQRSLLIDFFQLLVFPFWLLSTGKKIVSVRSLKIAKRSRPLPQCAAVTSNNSNDQRQTLLVDHTLYNGGKARNTWFHLLVIVAIIGVVTEKSWRLLLTGWC